MKIKTIWIGVLIILTGWFVYACYTHPDYYPLVKIPVMTNGYNVKKVYDNPKYTKSLNYFLKAEYPAEEVISFYNSQFKEDGWIISKDKFKGEWLSFIDGTQKGNPKIRQRASLWIKPDLGLEAFLALKYEMKKNEWSDLHVMCQIQPNVDYSKLEQYVEKLHKDNIEIYKRFMEQIDSILESNGDLNGKKINHALAANKDLAPYLIEYKKMTDEFNSEIKDILAKNK